MKLTSWGVLALVGSLIFLLLFIKGWETKMEAEKRSRKLPHHSDLSADPQFDAGFGARPLHADRAPAMI